MASNLRLHTLAGIAALLSLPATASAQAPAEPPRWMVHANLAVNAFTWLAPTQSAAARWITPADRLILLQQLGVGYQVHPHLRVQLTLQLAETVTGLSPNESSFALFGAIPWVVFTHGRFFAGTGVLLAPRAAGRWDFDLGWFTGMGVTFPLGNGWAVAAAVQAPVMLLHRISVAVSPALVLSRRF